MTVARKKLEQDQDNIGPPADGQLGKGGEGAMGGGPGQS